MNIVQWAQCRCSPNSDAGVSIKILDSESFPLAAIHGRAFDIHILWNFHWNLFFDFNYTSTIDSSRNLNAIATVMELNDYYYYV